MTNGKGTPADPWILKTAPVPATLIDRLGLVELEHNSRNNRVLAK